MVVNDIKQYNKYSQGRIFYIKIMKIRMDTKNPDILASLSTKEYLRPILKNLVSR